MLPVTIREDTRVVPADEHNPRPARAERWPSQHESLLQRFRGEYLEMPGLRLTLQQAQRLFAVDRALCQTLLGTLVRENFLSLKSDGTYVRLTEGRWPTPRPAKAELRGETKAVTVV